ncbi:MAG TPA: hypothetical protein VK188_05820 [Holophaga sp.]|nr:hypothetical protein [Holophaga sp.]
MKILALEMELVPDPAAFTADLLRAEARALWELQVAGLVRECHFRADRHEAVLALECAGVEEAREALGRLPLVREGLIAFELVPLAPYDGFARLFGQGEA